jgi:deaminated glutathione amidase
MKVAALQMVSGMQVDANLRAADALMQSAAAQGAELVALPEYFCILGQRDTDKLQVQESAGGGPIQQFLADAARRYGVWVVGGTLPISTANPARVRNTCLAFNPQGMQVARYDKMHLFAYHNGTERYDESRVLEAGDTPVGFALPSRDGHTWRVGLSVCYDLRFAQLYRSLQADLLLVPSAFTYTTGQAHWEVLLRARAIENLAYVLAPAQGGEHDNGRRTWGHSMVVDCWGSVLAQQVEGVGVVLAELSIAQVQTQRTQLPTLSHHRTDLSATVALPSKQCP